MITLSFHGAARTVTGSKYLLTVNDTRVLIDCGMFQGRREIRQRNWQPLPFDPATVDALIITHAHVDHIGYLPRVTKLGYTGPIYMTPPTVEICELSLRDSARIQEEDAEYRNRKKLTRHAVALPLFTEEDTEAMLPQLTPVLFDQWQEVNDDVRFRFHIAGHVLGAASVEIEARDGERVVRILFSGDVGRYGNRLTNDPEEPPQVDYLVCESTYGGRLHPVMVPEFAFTDLITEAVKDKSVLLIPAFAIGRTQQITTMITQLICEERIPAVDVYIDSPMAVSATDIYRRFPSYHKIPPEELGGNSCSMGSDQVHLIRKRKGSKKLNDLDGPAIIISSSGMLTGGRILHHLLNRIDDPRTTLALVGYMAEGTLGRRLLEGEGEIAIHKQPKKVRARVVNLTGMSGHADYNELLHWLEPITQAPQMTFLTHGELDSCEALAEHIRSERNWPTMIPEIDQTVELV